MHNDPLSSEEPPRASLASRKRSRAPYLPAFKKTREESNRVGARALQGCEPTHERAGAAGCGRRSAKQVTALYQAHALGLLRLAVIMLGERQAAEDAVQDAFLGLFRRLGRAQRPRARPRLRPLERVQRLPYGAAQRARNPQFALVEPPHAESADARLLLALTKPAPWTGCAAPTDTAYPGFAVRSR